MGRTTSTVLGPDGIPVVRHAAGPGPLAEAIRRETRMLALARGPGVVDLVASGDEPDGGAWLCTRYLAGGTLVDIVQTEGEAAATAALAHVAGTLADLHERGIVHGRCTAEHVVGGPAGATLCGFSAAAAAVIDGRVDPTLDTSAFAALVAATLTSDDEPSRRARRAVAGLASPPHGTNLRAVATELWALAHDAGWADAPPTPWQRCQPGGRPAPGAPPSAPLVKAPPEQSRADEPEVRRFLPHPSGRLRSGLPPSGPSLPGPRPPGPRPPGALGSRRVRRAVLGATLAACLALFGGLLLRPHDAGPPDDSVHIAVAPAPTTTASQPPAREVPVRVWPDPDEPAAEPPPVGRPEPGRGAAGVIAPVVEHDGIRYQVGAPGDIVVLGDWDCDGAPTPSVVRPADGSVWAFRGWAPSGEVVVAEALGYALAPVAAAAIPERGGCDVLAITTADGREVVVRPG